MLDQPRYKPIALPMYDWPEVRAATEVLECELSRAIFKAVDIHPNQIWNWRPDQDELPTRWANRGLLLSQTCGYPLVTFLQGKVEPLLTPHYDAPGCEGPLYCSHILVRAGSGFDRLEDLEGKRAAFNSRDSQSGYNAFRHCVAQVAGGKAFFGETLETGGHLKSMEAVAAGKADVCCTDAVCLDLVRRVRPGLFSALKAIGRSRQVPGLPLVTAAGHPRSVIENIRAAAVSVFEARNTQESRERLGIRGFSVLSSDDYRPLIEMRLEAENLGYPELV
ncbi:phosphate/phosphite/phosphonate ABC transporter substrate-binding protein [Roseibium polysiphoniae]|nr:PhnD/SsuA/transferrin family substrate-binding protein [Roseibium polysiphoniae]